MRMTGMRAVAYTTTAWTFNEDTPKTSQVIENITMTYEKDRAKKAWNEASIKTRNVLEGEAKKRNVKKSSIQITLKAVGNGSQSELCHILLKSYEKKLSGPPLETWKSNYKILYPN